MRALFLAFLSLLACGPGAPPPLPDAGLPCIPTYTRVCDPTGACTDTCTCHGSERPCP